MDEIIPNLWLGNVYEVLHEWHKFDTIITVFHLAELDKFELDDYKAIEYPNLINIPILRNNWVWSESLKDYVYGETWVDPIAIECVATCISRALDYNKKKVLVACMASQERSPLTIIWYLHNYCIEYWAADLKKVFEFVKSKHPQTLDRLSWLNKCLNKEG